MGWPLFDRLVFAAESAASEHREVLYQHLPILVLQAVAVPDDMSNGDNTRSNLPILLVDHGQLIPVAGLQHWPKDRSFKIM